MKTKEKLTKQLQTIFSINDDPFEGYKDAGYYKTKFKLVPETIIRNDRIWEIRTPFNDAIEHEGSDKGYLDDFID